MRNVVVLAVGFELRFRRRVSCFTQALYSMRFESTTCVCSIPSNFTQHAQPSTTLDYSMMVGIYVNIVGLCFVLLFDQIHQIYKKHTHNA